MGCEVANHSYSHANMAELSPKDILKEVESTSRLVTEYIGIPPKFFRPPYIALNQTMFDTIDLPFIEGYGCNDWDNSVSVEERVNGILNHSQDGNIILLHDLEENSKTVQAIDIVIPQMLSKGCVFVTVSKLFELNHIEPLTHNNAIYSNVNTPKVCTW
jgi:peptidoglycan/xylan/chitin deacetylase (PgdA/CDA1 family)